MLDTSIDEANQCFDHIRQQLSNDKSLNHPRANSSKVTLSAGIARIDQQGSNINDPYQLLNKADQALYESKNNGRDRITMFKP